MRGKGGGRVYTVPAYSYSYIRDDHNLARDMFVPQRASFLALVVAAAAGSYLPQQLLGCKDAHTPGVHARYNMLVWCACDVGGLRAVGSPPV